MKYTNMSDINFGQIQAFVTVADMLSFTKAAEMLYTSQSVISKRISALETKLDMPLLIRDRKKLQLTPAGQVLHSAWGKTISGLVESINLANTFQTGYSKRLSIGYCASFFAKGIGDYFNLLRPDVEIYYTKLQYPDMLSSLLSGDIDIMAYGGFAAKDLAREPFGYKIFGNYPQLLRCLPTNPLAKKAEVSIDDLRGQHLLMLSPLIAPMWLNYVTDLCIQERFLPQVAMYVDEVTSLAMNLRYDDQAFIADYAVSFEKFDIVSVPIKNTSCGFMLAWNKEKTNAVVKEFLAASESYFKELERQGYFSDFRK